jgi:hypothetical protein
LLPRSRPESGSEPGAALLAAALPDHKMLTVIILPKKVYIHRLLDDSEAQLVKHRIADMCICRNSVLLWQPCVLLRDKTLLHLMTRRVEPSHSGSPFFKLDVCIEIVFFIYLIRSIKFGNKRERVDREINKN